MSTYTFDVAAVLVESLTGALDALGIKRPAQGSTS